GHRAAQRPDQVHRPVRDVGRAVQDLLHRPDRPEFDAGAAGDVAVVGLAAPVVAASRRLGGAGEGGADHDGVGAAGERLGDVAAVDHAAVGDHVDVASAGLVEVVAAGGGHVRDGGRHRDGDAEDGAGGVPGAAAEPDQHARRAGAHQVQRGRVGGAAADDDGDVEVVDELLEVERFGASGDVLGGHGGAADDEQVDAGVDDGLVELGGALRRQP